MLKAVCYGLGGLSLVLMLSLWSAMRESAALEEKNDVLRQQNQRLTTEAALYKSAALTLERVRDVDQEQLMQWAAATDAYLSAPFMLPFPPAGGGAFFETDQAGVKNDRVRGVADYLAPGMAVEAERMANFAAVAGRTGVDRTAPGFSRPFITTSAVGDMVVRDPSNVFSGSSGSSSSFAQVLEVPHALLDTPVPTELSHALIMRHQRASAAGGTSACSPVSARGADAPKAHSATANSS